jgi:hypothetical protein
MVRDASSGSTVAAGWAHSHRIGMPADPVAIPLRVQGVHGLVRQGGVCATLEPARSDGVLGCLHP